MDHEWRNGCCLFGWTRNFHCALAYSNWHRSSTQVMITLCLFQSKYLMIYICIWPTNHVIFFPYHSHGGFPFALLMIFTHKTCDQIKWVAQKLSSFSYVLSSNWKLIQILSSFYLFPVLHTAKSQGMVCWSCLLSSYFG